MKKYITLLVIGLLMICLQAISQGKVSMTGAYWMTKQMGNDGTKDTMLKKEQLKIYTDQYMIYASPRSTDSFGEYGIATYRMKGDNVIEDIFYTSSSGEVKDTALLKITKLKNGFRQVIEYKDDDGKFILTEEYEKVGKPVRSPLDGAWRQVRNVFVNSKGDTLSDVPSAQVKVYQAGYFVWANPFKDPSSNNFVSAYGYGTFKMNGNKCEETNINSTYYSMLVNKPITVAIEMMGRDAYKQTIQPETGERSIEIYERMKPGKKDYGAKITKQ